MSMPRPRPGRSVTAGIPWLSASCCESLGKFGNTRWTSATIGPIRGGACCASAREHTASNTSTSADRTRVIWAVIVSARSAQSLLQIVGNHQARDVARFPGGRQRPAAGADLGERAVRDVVARARVIGGVADPEMLVIEPVAVRTHDQRIAGLPQQIPSGDW